MEDDARMVDKSAGGEHSLLEHKVLDPFDPHSLRLDATVMNAELIQRELLTVPVRKPLSDEWVRTMRGADHKIPLGVLELKSEREMYLLGRDVQAEMMGDATFSSRMCFPTISRQGVFFLWALRLPNADGRIDSWSASALEAATLAEDKWVRLTANMPLGAYNVSTFNGALAEPSWPEKSFRDILAIAFKGKLIDSMDHPVVKHLRGAL